MGGLPRVFPEFFGKHIRNFGKRIFYNYYLRDMSLASIELPLGIASIMLGAGLGGSHWLAALQTHVPTPTGTIVLSALGVILGVQLLLAFLAYDITSVPRRPLHLKLRSSRRALRVHNPG